MPKWLYKLTHFNTRLALTMTALLFFLVSFFGYVEAERSIDKANHVRFQSFLLADELRQSSDDLTRMVRTYAVTGDVRFREHFNEILAIRNGEAPRPENYHFIYWDLVDASNQRPRLFAKPETLLERMRNVGFTETELFQLISAKQASDDLAAIEQDAIQWVASADPLLQAQAITMLHDETYHQAKAGIMQPIDQLYRMMNLRTLAAVAEAEKQAQRLRWLFLLLLVMLVILLWKVNRILQVAINDKTKQQRLLESTVNERTLALQESSMTLSLRSNELQKSLDELAIKNHELTRLDKLKDQFVATVSHELRTPLTAIRGAVGLLAQGVLAKKPEAQQQMLDTALKNAERLSYLINDLLDLQKFAAGKFTLSCTALDLQQLTQDALQDISSYAEKFKVQLHYQPQNGPFMVNADAMRIRQVVDNLISNAVKFSHPAGTVKLTLTADNDWVTLSVIDQGSGIAAAFQPQIFSNFSQADASDSRSKEGTGLGLAICKNIIDSHQGDIGFSSTEDQGSHFWFRLARSNR